MSSAAFARGARAMGGTAGALSNDVYSRFGYPGPEIKVQPFNAQDYSPGAEFAKLGLSLVSHARTMANVRQARMRFGLQNALLNARTQYLLGRLNKLDNPDAPLAVVNLPDPNDPTKTIAAPVKTAGELYNLGQNLNPNSPRNVNQRGIIAARGATQARDARREGRIDASTDLAHGVAAAKSWAAKYADRHLAQWDADPKYGGKLVALRGQLAGLVPQSDGTFTDPKGNKLSAQDVAGMKSQYQMLFDGRNQAHQLYQRSGMNYANTWLQRAQSGDPTARAQFGMPSFQMAAPTGAAPTGDETSDETPDETPDATPTTADAWGGNMQSQYGH